MGSQSAAAGLEKKVKASKKAKESLDKEGVAIGMVAPLEVAMGGTGGEFSVLGGIAQDSQV